MNVLNLTYFQEDTPSKKEDPDYSLEDSQVTIGSSQPSTQGEQEAKSSRAHYDSLVFQNRSKRRVFQELE